MRKTVKWHMNNHRDNFDGYNPPQPLATDPDLAIEVEINCWPVDKEIEALIDRAYTIGNRIIPDATGREWPTDVRSVSIGDVAEVDGVFYAINRGGLREVDEPRPSLIVPLAGAERVTSR